MRPSSPAERRALNDLFAQLCAIPSPSGSEEAMAARIGAELDACGIAHSRDARGNMLARVPATGASEGDRPGVVLCVHLDTVPHALPIEPVLVDDGWENCNEAILGADNKAAVAMVVLIARRIAAEGTRIPVELLFTMSEERGLQGVKEFDVSSLQGDLAFVFDHATPIGDVIVASPTQYHLEAEFHGKAAHAGIRPEDGRSAILAAAKAIAGMQIGRVDPESSANVGTITGGAGGTNVVPERCSLLAEARSLRGERAEEIISAMVDRCYDAANDPACPCDVAIDVEKMFDGYRHAPTSRGVLAGEAALRACGYEPRHVASGGASDGNILQAAGLETVNLANGTERAHEVTERVSVAALEGMLDVSFALLGELSH